jgi:hypothetical protein
VSFLHFKVVDDCQHTDDLEGEFGGSLLFFAVGTTPVK